MEPIWDYIIDGRIPDDKKEAANYWPTILKDATDLVKKCRIC